MEARQVDELPRDKGWQFEPKWDGFRCLASPRRRQGRVDGPVGQEPGPLLSRRSSPPSAAAAAAVSSSTASSSSRSARSCPSMRCSCACIPPRAGCQARRRDAVDADRVRPAADARRRSHRAAFERTAHGAGEALRALADAPHCACRRDRRERAEAARWLARARRRRARWRRRQAPRRALSRGRAGDAEDEMPAHADCVVGGFRYATGGKAGRLVAARPLRRRGQLDHVGFTSAISDADTAGADAQARRLARRARIHRRCAGRSQPLVDRAQRLNGSQSSPSWSSRCSTITSPASAFATARASCAGGPTSGRGNAPWISCSAKVGRRG